MAYDRFLITPFKSGLETLMKPWQVAEDSFTTLNNAYVFRGRVRKRVGGELMGTGAPTPQTEPLLSRLRIQVATTDASGDAAGTVPGSIFKVGQAFSIGTEIFTVQAMGTPVIMLDTGASATHTYNTTTGAYVFAGAAALTAVYFYPGEPVMGFANYEVGPINDQPSYAFDTQFAYIFTNGWSRSGTLLFHDPAGTKSNFVWTTNWEGVTSNIVTLFASNFQVTNPNGAAVATDDVIWYTSDGINWVALDATAGSNAFYFMPTGQARYLGPYIKNARIIIPFKNRLLLLNTIENNNPNHNGTLGTNTAYPNRCRFSHNGSPFAQNAWYEPNTMDTSGSANNQSIADGGGFIDATTEEQIVAAEFIKDRLIVYFERSSWELAYTGNEVLPFVWQKINTELGSESTFSSVPFDKAVLAIGNTGVHACSGANTERIDAKIPEQIFQIRLSNQGVLRVAGIRDYFNELVFWTIPTLGLLDTQIFPSKILLYNYQNSTWAYNDDCITAFGYFEQEQDLTWDTVDSSFTWENWDATWIDGVEQAQSRQVIAGNQEGYTFLVEDEVARNARVMQISQMTAVAGPGPGQFFVTITIVDHMLSNDEFIAIENGSGGVATGNYQINVIDKDTVSTVTFTGFTFYNGGASATRVSRINIESKQWNPYIDKGRNFYLARIDFAVDKTPLGEITIDYFPSSTELSMIQEGMDTGSIMGTGVLETRPYNPLYYPLEQEQEPLWHPIYFQSDGEFIQIRIYLSDTQMFNMDIAFSDFEMEGLVLHTQATRSRLE